MKPSLVYTDISPDICENDEDVDAEEWSYDGREVFRGALDVSYRSHGIDVYWLYDNNSDRVGLAEHNIEDRSDFRTLWFYDNDYGTLLQEEWKSANKSVWSLMTQEAYQDHAELSYLDLAVKSGKIVIPEFLIKGLPDVYFCKKCNKTSLLPITCYDAVKKKLKLTSDPLFIDDSGILRIPPSDSRVIRWLSAADHPLTHDEPERSPEEAQRHQPQQDESQLPQQELPPLEEAPPQPQTELQPLHETEGTPEQT